MPPLPSRKIHWIGGAAGDRIIESAGGAWPIQELAFSPNFGVVLTRISSPEALFAVLLLKNLKNIGLPIVLRPGQHQR
jgi:hypothetical protein